MTADPGLNTPRIAAGSQKEPGAMVSARCRSIQASSSLRRIGRWLTGAILLAVTVLVTDGRVQQYFMIAESREESLRGVLFLLPVLGLSMAGLVFAALRR